MYNPYTRYSQRGIENKKEYRQKLLSISVRDEMEEWTRSNRSAFWQNICTESESTAKALPEWLKQIEEDYGQKGNREDAHKGEEDNVYRRLMSNEHINQ